MKTKKIPERFCRIKEWFSQGKFLDIGCGEGELAEYINGELYGRECNRIKAQMAKTKTYREVIIGDAEEDLLFLHNYFDAVICSES